MKKYNYKSAPFEIHGIPFFASHGKMQRMPDTLVESIPSIKEAAYRLSGVRLLFRTNSKSIKIEIRVSNVYVDRGYAFYQSNVAPVFIGEHRTSRFAGILSADNSFDSDMIYGTFENDGMNDVTVHLPQKPCVEDIDIYLDDDAEVLAPTPFTVEKPFLFYGSSIVENGHCGVQNGYPALLAREFDADFYNLGVSGAARGEQGVGADELGPCAGLRAVARIVASEADHFVRRKPLSRNHRAPGGHHEVVPVVGGGEVGR